MTLNWKAAWPFLVGAVMVTSAQVQDIYDGNDKSDFDVDYVVISWLNVAGLLFGTITKQEAEKLGSQPKNEP